MSQQHIIQKRDLIEMLKPFEDFDEVACNSGGEECAILRVGRAHHSSRRIGIEIDGGEQSSALSDELEDLAAIHNQAKLLLERFDKIMRGADESQESDLNTLHADVKTFLQ